MDKNLQEKFSEPVLKLISQGENTVRNKRNFDYLSLGIGKEHIPELIRIIQNTEYFIYDLDEDDEDWGAPIHAWRALGQLKAEEAIPALIQLIVENENWDFDWVMEEIPDVMAKIGPVCIPSLEKYLQKPKRQEWASVTVAHCLADVGNANPESRTDCIAVLESALKNYKKNTKEYNAFLISYLADLNAAESDTLVKRAFDADAVDFSIMGDYEEYQIAVGLLDKRITPAPRFSAFPSIFDEVQKPSITKKELSDLFKLVDPDIKKGKF
jgi:hypothetical protein